METAILFLIFNRPEKTKRVFEQIRQAKPKRFFIAADGPRLGKAGEVELCEQTRKTALDFIDWPCDVKTLFREKNLGCKIAVSSAIDWFFEHVEEGIILEDDCLPDPTFFRFCAELLEKYRDSEQVMMISGNNFQPEKRGEASYFFSRYVHIWGWATWRRAWKHYDLPMEKWPESRDQRTLYEFLPRNIARKREQQFNKAYSEDISTWDTQWVFSCWEAEGLCILPNFNLVKNIDSTGTHMKIYDPCTNRRTEPMSFPLSHPSDITPHEQADAYTEKNVVLRGWPRTLWLIIQYLTKILAKRPGQFPHDAITILKSLVSELRNR